MLLRKTLAGGRGGHSSTVLVFETKAFSAPPAQTKQAVRPTREHAGEFDRRMGSEVVPVNWKSVTKR
jgi:hypothetical protein